MKKIKKFFITVVIIATLIWVLHRLNVLPSPSNLFRSQPVVIDKTPILIKNIKSIGQLITYTAYDEVVISSTRPTRGSAFVNGINKILPIKLPSADKQIVLIAKGKVLAGTNLNLLTDTSVIATNDTVTVYLPKPQIFDAILNPSDFETFKETGQWSNDEVTEVKLQARQKMTDRALQQNILDKAGVKSKEVLSAFLTNLGYKEVFIY